MISTLNQVESPADVYWIRRKEVAALAESLPWESANETPDATASAGAPGSVSAPLGNNADFASTVDSQQVTVLPPPSTVKAWYLRSCGREILKNAGVSRRMRWCGSRIARNVQGVSVFARPDRAYGRVSGVCVCGQSVCCPVCAPRIAAFRASEVAIAFQKATALGYEARLVTYTIPHVKASSLANEIDCFAAAWRLYNSGREAKLRNENSLGNHVGRECTYGEANGWHYHFHQLRYDRPNSFDSVTGQKNWLNALGSVQRKWRGADDHAFDSGVVGNEAGARYVAKLATSVEAQARAIGFEVSSGATKGRNLASLLLHASQGDQEAGRVWLSGVEAITARKVSSVRWSRGLRATLGITGEKTDEQISEDEKTPDDEFLGALNPHQWRGILNYRAEFPLCVAANQGRDSVNRFLAGLQLGQLDDAPTAAIETNAKSDYCYARIQSKSDCLVT